MAALYLLASDEQTEYSERKQRNGENNPRKDAANWQRTSSKKCEHVGCVMVYL